MTPPSNRRSNIEIYADMLRLLRLGPATRVEIMHVAHLSSDQLSRILVKFVEEHLIEESAPIMELPAVKITGRGLTLLNLIESIRDMIPEEGAIAALHTTKLDNLNIGQVMMSKGVSGLMATDKGFADFVNDSLGRYRKGDWGEPQENERQRNVRNVDKGYQMFSCYEKEGFPEIWITTTADRSYTSILLPSEDASLVPMESFTGKSHSS